MADEARNSDLILQQARQSLANQRAGGRRRPLPRGAARIKARHWGRKAMNIGLAVLALWLGLSIVGSIIGGIGFTGLMVGIAGTVGAVWAFGRYPRFKLPQRSDLDPQSTDARALVGRTELWLESQRRALPPPAVKLVDHIGLQLDALSLQLADVDPAHPQAAEVRKLVGEHLPDIVEGYRKIPEHLRYEERAGSTPTKQFVDSLTTISAEIDSVTRQLASGAIDDLAIKTRYLDYKYGDAMDAAEGHQ
ncbi:hypothetical protein [Novosphingobium sp.]|uniref:hypothetical protein n=1 Tax=Novosphingobium sp. TaxID=1874826 RepID=UPI0035AF3517